MLGNKLLQAGLIGTILTALCCFTTTLVIGLGTVGLAAATAWLDVILLPLLGVFLCLTHMRCTGDGDCHEGPPLDPHLSRVRATRRTRKCRPIRASISKITRDVVLS